MIYYLVTVAENPKTHDWREYGIITATSNKDAQNRAWQLFSRAYDICVTRINELDFNSDGYYHITEK